MGKKRMQLFEKEIIRFSEKKEKSSFGSSLTYWKQVINVIENSGNKLKGKPLKSATTYRA